MEIQRYPHANHEGQFRAVSRSCLPTGITVQACPIRECAGRRAGRHGREARRQNGRGRSRQRLRARAGGLCRRKRSAAFVEALFDAFRERGESSEDAAEGRRAPRWRASRQRDDRAVNALLEYARTNPGLLKRTTALFVEHRPDSGRHAPGAAVRRDRRASFARHVNDPPRRRRSDDDPDRRGRPAAVSARFLIVIFAGLLLGGVMAHFFGGARTAPKATPGRSSRRSSRRRRRRSQFAPALPRPSRIVAAPVAANHRAPSAAPAPPRRSRPSPCDRRQPSISKPRVDAAATLLARRKP